jgi:hypothetical protein
MLTMANYLAIQAGAISHCTSWVKSYEPDLAISSTNRCIWLVRQIVIEMKAELRIPCTHKVVFSGTLPIRVVISKFLL